MHVVCLALTETKMAGMRASRLEGCGEQCTVSHLVKEALVCREVIFAWACVLHNAPPDVHHDPFHPCLPQCLQPNLQRLLPLDHWDLLATQLSIKTRRNTDMEAQ